jgi:hypothetical protein
MTERDPTQDLSFPVSRRRFLPLLLKEAVVTLGMFQGKQALRLSDLGKLPDEELALIVPMVNPACEILVEGGEVLARWRESDTVARLFALDDAESLFAFNQFNGRHNLGDIGLRLASEMGWEEEAGWEPARALFLKLVSMLVCVPKNLPEPPGG